MRQLKVNPIPFISEFTPESTYLLGLIWADGNLNFSGTANTICIKSTFPDGDEFYKICLKTGEWRYYCYENHKNPTWKPSITIQTNNKPLALFLKKFGYSSKNDSPANLLKLIPEHLKHYWWRGYFDGDGSLYLKKSVRQVCFSSEYMQDWTFVLNLGKKLNINFNVSQNVSAKGHKSSLARVSSGINCSKLLNYIYQGAENDGIFLQRKYQKYLDFKENIKDYRFIKRNPRIRHGAKGIQYIKNKNKWRATYYDRISKKSIYISENKSKDESIKMRQEFLIKNNIIERGVDLTPKINKYYS